jgi:hypothetical protein
MMDSGILSRFRDPPFPSSYSSSTLAPDPFSFIAPGHSQRRKRERTEGRSTAASTGIKDKAANERLLYETIQKLEPAAATLPQGTPGTPLLSSEAYRLQYKALRVPPPEPPAPVVLVDLGPSTVYYGQLKTPSPLLAHTDSASKLHQVYLTPNKSFKHVKIPALIKADVSGSIRPSKSMPSLSENNPLPDVVHVPDQTTPVHTSPDLAPAAYSEESPENKIDVAELESKLAGPACKLFANKTRLHDFISDTAYGKVLGTTEVVNITYFKLGLDINESEAETIGNSGTI